VTFSKSRPQPRSALGVLRIFFHPPWPLGAFAIGQGAASGVGLEGSGPQLIRRPNSRILGLTRR
jgi:hypothetical protein